MNEFLLTTLQKFITMQFETANGKISHLWETAVVCGLDINYHDEIMQECEENIHEFIEGMKLGSRLL